MSDAPERIWFTKVGNDIVPNSEKRLAGDVEYIRADLSPQWQTIDSAPRDVPIVAIHKSSCQDPSCGYCEDKYLKDQPTGLCTYHAHAEGLASAEDGPCVVAWGGSWEDSWEDGGGSMPDWWFQHGSEFEVAANPTHWMPLPKPPT